MDNTAKTAVLVEQPAVQFENIHCKYSAFVAVIKSAFITIALWLSYLPGVRL
ncbi:MAG TPA: hypothetical protein VIF86_07725 [Methylobacter sp.]|jgi:hypothetical protein